MFDTKKLPRLMQINLWLLVIIIVLLPFQGFVTTWPGANFGHLLVWRAWKEVLLAIMGGLLIIQAFRDHKMTGVIFGRRVNQLILAFTVLLLLLWAVFRPSLAAATQGMIIDIRFLAVFVLVQALVYYGWHPDWKFLAKVIMIPAAVVAIFGLLEVTVLPRNFLSHFGYSKATILPFYTLYQNSSVIRINSFLRGPNPLGAYLILPFTLLVAWFFKKRESFKWWYGLWFIPGLITLYYSQSRSAWFGLVVALVVFVWLALPKWRRNLALFGSIVIIVVAGLFVGFQKSAIIQNSVFHTGSNHQVKETSNSDHLASIESSWRDVWRHPFGQGPGSAGPASVRDIRGSQVVENFYLQIAEEAGWLGLILLMAILVYVFLELYKQRQDFWSLVLIASLVGISLANLFLPVWADDTLSIIWWSLAGLTIAQDLSWPKSRKKPDLG